MRANKLKRIIYLLDKHILGILSKIEVDDDKLSVLTDIRSLYISELNNLIRNMNTGDMYDKEYWKSYRKTKY